LLIPTTLDRIAFGSTLSVSRRQGRTTVDEPKWKPGWLEWALIIALVVAVVILALFILGPQYGVIYQHGPDNLWLHIVGL
jgi:hypothetical protein